MDQLLLAALAATLLSAFFATAGYALRESTRRGLEAVFTRRPALLEKLQKNLSELQLLCALLRTLANISLLVVMLYVFGAALDKPLALLLAVLATLAIIGIFGLAMPQAYARSRGPQFLAALAGVLLALRVALWPVVIVLLAFASPIRRLTGLGAAGEPSHQQAVKNEILQAASEAQAEGAVAPEEVDMIESVIQFGDRQAWAIMTPRTELVAMPVGASVEEVTRRIVQSGHSRLPIYDGDIDNIIGLVHAKDLLAVADPAGTNIKKLLRKPTFVPESKRLGDLLREFKAGKVHMSVVLDEYGGTAGVVTIEDLIEEIVGEISDEYDRPGSALIRPGAPGVVEADGRARLDDINEQLGLQLPQTSDYDTVAGLLSAQLGFIPPVGEVLQTGGARITVLAADERRIWRVRVEKLEPE